MAENVNNFFFTPKTVILLELSEIKTMNFITVYYHDKAQILTTPPPPPPPNLGF